jgi:hypothetical protein
MVMQFRRLSGEARGSPITITQRGTRVCICTRTVSIPSSRAYEEHYVRYLYTSRGQAKRAEHGGCHIRGEACLAFLALAETFVRNRTSSEAFCYPLSADVELRGQCHSSFRPRPLIESKRLSLHRRNRAAWQNGLENSIFHRLRRSVHSLTSAHRFRPLLGGPRRGFSLFSFFSCWLAQTSLKDLEGSSSLLSGLLAYLR